VYYNTKIAQWEPVLEPWGFELNVNARSDASPGAVTSEATISEDVTIVYELVASEKLNINVTKAFYDTINQTLDMYGNHPTSFGVNLCLISY